MLQSTQNHFELCWTFCPSNHGSLARRFKISLNILCPMKIQKTFADHFKHFAQFCPALGSILFEMNFCPGTDRHAHRASGLKNVIFFFYIKCLLILLFVWTLLRLIIYDQITPGINRSVGYKLHNSALRAV